MLYDTRLCGQDVAHFLLTGFGILDFYGFKCETAFAVAPTLKNAAAEVRWDDSKRNIVFWKILQKLIDDGKQKLDTLFFSTEKLTAEAHTKSRRAIEGFLKVATRDVPTLREEMESVTAFNVLPLATSLCPFERYPVTRLDDGSLIVPNIRYFQTSLPELLFFALQEQHPQNQFNEVYGSIQEYYLTDLTQARLTNCTVLGELEYKRGRNTVRGPDTIVIEENGRLVAIESKAKRFRAQSRLEPLSNSVPEDLDRVYSALRGLPQKVRDIEAGAGDYSAYSEKIAKSEDCPAVCVAVVGGGLELMPEAVAYAITKDAGNFLNNFTHPYCVIDANDFEYAVEVAAMGEFQLSELLLRYWQSALSFVQGKGEIMSLRKHTFSFKGSFRYKFAVELFEELNQASSEG